SLVPELAISVLRRTATFLRQLVRTGDEAIDMQERSMKDKRKSYPRARSMKACRDRQAIAETSALEKPDLHELLQLCLRYPDENLWAEFIRRSQPLITRVIIHCVRQWPGDFRSLDVVEDLVQETFLKLWANNFRPLRQFECHHENAIYGFLKVVASSVVHDHFRGSYSQKRGSGQSPVCLNHEILLPSKNNDAAHMEREVLLHAIRRIFIMHSDQTNFQRDYAIFWLYYRHGLSCSAIARISRVGLTVKGVESALLRLTRLLKKHLTPGTAPPSALVPA